VFLEDVWETRTNNTRTGTVVTEWDKVLLWRDLRRLIAVGLVEPTDGPADNDPDPRERKYFRDVGTGEVYVYISGWERGSPEFRRQA
jgi:hypothetical protein